MLNGKIYVFYYLGVVFYLLYKLIGYFIGIAIKYPELFYLRFFREAPQKLGKLVLTVKVYAV